MASPSDKPVFVAFLEQYWKDREEGSVRDLEEYISQFPGDGDAIGREYFALQDGREPQREAVDSGEDSIGPYKTLKELGRGGQGVVWLAEDTRLGRNVALKILTGSGMWGEEHLARFKREAMLASRLDHPGICGVHETGIEAGVPYIAMRYVEGESLADRLKRLRSDVGHDGSTSFQLSFDSQESTQIDTQPEEEPTRPAVTRSTSLSRREIDEFISMFIELASALQAAHEVGIIHRDIKPGNIMVSEEGHPVILDFGLARDDRGDGPTLTHTGDLFGTPAYMSPEQITGFTAQLDRRSDIYSLGVSFYECLTLRQPFEEPTREALYKSILTKEAVPPRKLNRAIPSDLEIVLLCAMEKERDRRYQTAADLAEDLRRVRDREPVLAKKISVFGRTWRWAKRRPAVAVLLFTLAAGIPSVSFLGAWYWMHREDVKAAEEAKLAELVEDQLEIGLYELHHGDNRNVAARAFRQAIELDETCAEATVGLAYFHLSGQAPKEALTAIERGEKAGIDAGVLARTKAEILRRLGRDPEALAVLEGAPEIEGPVMWFLEGIAASARGHAAVRHQQDESHPAFGEAVEWLMRAVGACPAPRRAYYFELSHALGHTDDEETQKVVADVIASLWPDSPTAWLRIGFSYRMTNPERSVAAYRTARRMDPTCTATLYELGTMLSRQDELDEAIRCYREVIRFEPENASALCNLGTVLRNAGQTEEAIEVTRKALRIEPDNVQALYSLGIMIGGRGEVEEGIKLLRRACVLAPAAKTPRVSLGRLLHEKGESGEAVSVYREALELAPEDHRIHLGLGEAFHAMGRFDDAIRACREAIRLNPEPADGYALAAASLTNSGRPAEALPLFRQALERAPDHVQARVNLGNALKRLRRPDEALASYRKALEVEPGNAAAHSGRGGTLLEQGQFKEAIDALREADRLQPDSYFTKYHLGLAHQQLGQLDDAEAAYREALRVNPASPQAHCNLGHLLSRRGDSEAAVASFEKGHELGTKLGRAWRYPSGRWLENAYLRRARELYIEDKLDEAVSILRKAFKKHPSLLGLKKRLRLLEREL